MKRTVLFTFLLALFGAVSGWAQTGGCIQRHPDPTAVPGGAMQVTLSLAASSSTSASSFSGSPTVGSSTKKKKQTMVETSAAGTDQSGTVIVSIDIVIWKTSSGGVDYVFDPSTIRFNGLDEAAINQTSTLHLFDQIGEAIVAQGIRMGLNDCSPDCDNPSAVTRIFSSSCVERLGTGLKTRFVCCNSKSYCERTYTACCPSGVDAPVIKLLSVVSGTCSGTNLKCEPACP